MAADPKEATAAPDAAASPMAAVAAPFVPATPMAPRVLLYASPTTRAFFAAGGFDAGENVRTWEVFLRKYRIPFQVLPSVEQLEKSQPGVLLLPSAVALSEREKQAVMDFRAKGGGVLATWLAGIRNENGEWRGLDFMQRALDVRVVGNTEADENDIFMMPHGDNPVTHNLPAGLRIWLERVKNWYPIRMVGRHPAANIMDWSRTLVTDKPSSTIVFDERVQFSGRLSRSVVLGYPERLWLSADPKLLEAIAHNSLMWLLRQPDAYVAAWPDPYASAFVLAVDSADDFAEADLSFAKQFEDAGGRATYYVLSENVKKSADILRKIQAHGHELGFLGDRFKGFKDQSSAEQAKRLDTMRREVRDAGIDIATEAGFHAPMESYDKNTERLLAERSFGHYIAFMDGSDARLPFFPPVGAGGTKSAGSMVGLPRTQGGPEDEERDPAKGLQEFFGELDLVEQMAGLAVVRMPNQSSLDKVQTAEFFNHLKARSNRMWLATGGQVADWWRERARVSARLESSAVAPLLIVRIMGGGPSRRAAAVWVNLPESGGVLRVVAAGNYAKTPKIASVDAWRTAVVLDGFAPGEYQWYLYFGRPTASAGK
ncbi:MAG: hypothetical protein PHS32_04290 [Rhodoferax sp.]|uniref:polysaccharide deacetylase family protein n=1 Tax=Rhodoferax sp. TaxID=50421 RepID=UPI0026229762|nr:polysaccharide deacetylase family protein [Rhodoferax sp.]MDD5332945.1 hypothetical protein [Rhodoferax sp.]